MPKENKNGVCVGSIFHRAVWFTGGSGHESIFQPPSWQARKKNMRAAGSSWALREMVGMMRWSRLRWGGTYAVLQDIFQFSFRRKQSIEFYVYMIYIYLWNWLSWPMLWQEAMAFRLWMKNHLTKWNHPEYDEQKDHSCGKCQISNENFSKL